MFEVVGGGYTLIGKSNSTIAGTSVMIQFGGYNQASFPVMTERTESWEIVHDFDNSENGEWSNGDIYFGFNISDSINVTNSSECIDAQ